ncbi:MAG: phospho-N-acetylmuramoyl-pentapeptide-transferase [Phycisphaerales bacterium]|nr:phospho-N-acetylmuramoyl-pentapeptide-transferase [Phycisphaerales bacterium]
MFYNLLERYNGVLDEMGLYSLLQVLYQLEFRSFAAVVVSFLFVLLGGKPMIRWLRRQKLGDAPEFYREDVNALMASKHATPTMGGLLVCGSILVTVILFADLTNRYVHLALLVLVWLAVVGGFDDWLKLTTARRKPGSREGLYAWEKLLFQLGVGVLAGVFLYRNGIGSSTAHVLTLPFQRTYEPGAEALAPVAGVITLGAIPFIVICTLLIAGTSNAVNLTDGMDGLAAGCISVAAFAFMALAFIAGTLAAAHTLLLPFVEGSAEMMVVAGAMAGASLGFLWFNCAPAQVFMGDTGSLPLGGLLALIAVTIRQEVLLIIIGGVFFMELGSVVLQVGYFKATKGKRLFACSPIHHHFHLRGWSETQVVQRFWVLAIILAMVALVSLKLR